ncbi:MAG: hypothetical protein MJ164_02740 [Alphaproteobacteria bacterium]|nr:hypothetical protein [Alphaproteobacteria bacterium]
MASKIAHKYSDTELRRELNAVFSSVYFEDTNVKNKLRKQYFAQFDDLVDYARKHNIDEKRHIRSIQQDLLKLPQTRLLRHLYKKYELRRALTDVFNSVYFDNLDKKLVLQDSFFASFDSIVAYAIESTKDPIEYIYSIRDMLLKTPGCYEMEKVMTNITCPYDSYKCLKKERDFCVQSEFERTNNLQTPMIFHKKSKCPMSALCPRYPKLLLNKQRARQHG